MVVLKWTLYVNVWSIYLLGDAQFYIKLHYLVVRCCGRRGAGVEREGRGKRRNEMVTMEEGAMITD